MGKYQNHVVPMHAVLAQGGHITSVWRKCHSGNRDQQEDPASGCARPRRHWKTALASLTWGFPTSMGPGFYLSSVQGSQPFNLLVLTSLSNAFRSSLPCFLLLPYPAFHLFDLTASVGKSWEGSGGGSMGQRDWEVVKGMSQMANSSLRSCC